MRRTALILALLVSALTLRAQEVTVQPDSVRIGTAQSGQSQNSEALITEDPSWRRYSGQAQGSDARTAVPFTQPKFIILPHVPDWMYGGSSYSNYIGLGSVASAQIGYRNSYRNLSFQIGAGADKYMFSYVSSNNFYLNASATYSFSPIWSVTAFGQVASNSAFIAMQAVPYIRTSSYGATVNYSGDAWGLQVGARREFDPFTNSWEMYPVVVPSIKIGDFSFGVDVGPMIKQGYRRLQDRNSPPPPAPHPASEPASHGFPNVRR